MTEIVFDQIVAAFVPGSQMEFSNVRAVSGLPTAQQKLLLVGQSLPSGTVGALFPRRMTRAAEGANWFGRGSILAAMVAAAFAAVPEGLEIWACGIADNAGGTAATWTLTVTGPATGSGSIALMIAGQKVPVAVTSGETATQVATNIVAAVTAAADLPVTAGNVAGVVTLTCRHKGTVGNDIDVRWYHYDGDTLPSGIGLALAAGVAGATNPDLTTVWAAIGDEQYQAVAIGMADAANLTSADTEFTSRWGPQRQIEGRVFAATTGTFSTVQTFGLTRNGIFTTVIGSYKMPTPPWKFAAGYAAVTALSLKADPARPLTGLAIPGVIAPLPAFRYTRTERNQLLGSGISTFTVLPGGDVAIERPIACYQLNTFGFEDPSYLDVTTTATLGYLRLTWRARMADRFQRAKLTAATIAAARAETIALAQDWYNADLIEDLDGFKAGLVVERDPNTATQLNFLLTPDIVNGWLQSAARTEFYL